MDFKKNRKKKRVFELSLNNKGDNNTYFPEAL